MTYLADLKTRLALHNLMERASVFVPTNYCCLEMMIPTCVSINLAKCSIANSFWKFKRSYLSDDFWLFTSVNL